MIAKLLTTQEAATLIGYSDSHLRHLIADGEAKPKTQIGGTWLFSEGEVKRLRRRTRRALAGK